MINTYSFTRMIQMLMDGEVTRTEIIEETGLYQASVGRYIKHMHAKRVIRIAEYRRCKAGRTWVPYFTLNHEGLPDAKRPKAESSSVRNVNYRKRKAAVAINHMLAGQIRPNNETGGQPCSG